MKTHTIQVVATAAIVLTLVVGVLGTTPSTPNGVSHFNTSEQSLRRDQGQKDWAWLLKAPVRFEKQN